MSQNLSNGEDEDKQTHRSENEEEEKEDFANKCMSSIIFQLNKCKII
jgi:hypothetical protein